jgi:hypothetical protein
LAQGAVTSAPAPSSPVEITFYPLLLKAPIFGATINFPDLPDNPGGSGSTDLSWNAAYMFGGTIEGPHFLFDTNGVWAALSATRSAPAISVDSSTKFFNAIGGVRIVSGLFATGGVRRVSTDLDVTLTPPTQGAPLSGHTKPGLWDPMVGAQYRGRIRSRTKFDLDFRGGGFGVGTDVDVFGEAAVNWRIVPHVELRAGYSLIYFKLTVADVNVLSVSRTLIAKQTLHGPEFGIGITF